MIVPLLLLLTIGSMRVTGQMALRRHRSTRAWLWVAACVGPLAPLCLYVLGVSGHDARAARGA